MSLKGTAKETLKILKEGQYTSPSGKIIEFSKEQQAAVAGTVLYTPQQLQNLLEEDWESDNTSPAIIEVTRETTQKAARRLVQEENCGDLVLLNFASARNPGGGFLNGAKAQEEDLARCSGLYPCLLKQPEYFNKNRAQSSLLYTDHIIYSPHVPWFRERNRDLLENYYTASVITAPAPNAGHIAQKDAKELEETLRRRAGMILAIARKNAHRSLLLGAWGCGVFRNKPQMVADAFGVWLESPCFQGAFKRVVFAVYTNKNKETFTAFAQRFPM